jgi:DNA-binding NarL/FixJ family response regulator
VVSDRGAAGPRLPAIGAANADAALRILEQSFAKIDLMLTDVIMPGMNGRELSERARELRPGLKVLFCSCPAIRATRSCIMGASTSMWSSFKSRCPCRIWRLAFGTCWIESPDLRAQSIDKS